MKRSTYQKSRYLYIAVRRPTGTRINLGAKTGNTTVASVIETFLKSYWQGDSADPTTIDEASAITEDICKNGNMKDLTAVRRPFTLDELAELYALSDNQLRRLIHNAIQTGLRLEEVNRLNY